MLLSSCAMSKVVAAPNISGAKDNCIINIKMLLLLLLSLMLKLLHAIIIHFDIIPFITRI